jgi:lysine 2,3-aminomutase
MPGELQSWERVPAFAGVTPAEFDSWSWQRAHTVRTFDELSALLAGVADETVLHELRIGGSGVGMATRVTPYVLALVDWADPTSDPIRRQFLPFGSELVPNHPLARLDSLDEQRDSPVPGLVHRHRDRALLVTLDTCPVYCVFCTRSYSIGPRTASIDNKLRARPSVKRWQAAVQYIAAHSEIREVILSGGDAYQLAPAHLATLGTELAAIDHVRHLRIATRGLTAAPMRVGDGDDWSAALVAVADAAHQHGTRLALHVHFNSARELSGRVDRALAWLQSRCRHLTIRNQSVLLAGVNDESDLLADLCGGLHDRGVDPYYVFHHDLVPNAEHLRTPLHHTIALERDLACQISGPSVPRFVVDLPGGAGKRPVASFVHYDQQTGLSVWTGRGSDDGLVVHADPLHSLDPRVASRWADPGVAERYVGEALCSARDRAEFTMCPSISV